MSSPTNKQTPDTPSASPTAATAAAALTSSPNAFARSPSVCSQDSRSITGGGGGGGGAASITTTGSGSLTGSPSPLSSPRDLQQPQLLTNHPPQPQPAPSALAISAAKSAALAAVNITSSSSSSVGGGGGGNKVLPPPWPETTSSSPPTTTTAAAAAAVNKSLPAIPILRNNSHNSANSSAATTMPGLTHSISLTASTEDHSGTTSSNNTTTTTATNNANNNPSKLPTTAVGTATTGTAAAATTSVNSSVLLGLEELERQQAYAEKKKAELWKAEMTMKQHEGGTRRSLPPLTPAPSSGPAKFTPMMFSSQQQPPFSQQQQIMLQHQQQYANPNQLPPPPPQQYHYQHQFQQQPHHHHQQQHPNNPRSSPSNVPTQIHLTSLNNIDTDDPTALSSIENRSKEEDAASSTTAAQTQGGGSSGGGGGGSMKRIASIEKFQKSAQNTFRRFRSWSQGGGLTSSDATSTGGTGGGGYEGGGTGGKASRSMSMNSPPPPSSSSRKNLPTPNTPGLNPTPTKLPNPQQQQRLSETTQEPYLDEDELTPLIYGYLHKLGRNGHWQKRFFETNGERLTYYKSGKRKKVLATLDLYKVGEIAIDKTDPEECTFTIQVSNRPYYLRAEDKARCNDWVIILNRAREARHGWGNIQLVNPTGIDDDDVVGGVGGGRSQAGSDDEFGPCIVISALRPRTQAVNYGEDDAVLPPDLLSAGGVGGSEEQEQIEVLDGRDNPQLLMMQHQQQQQQYQMEDEQQLQGGRPVAVKWQKRHSAVHHLSMRMLNWARSITSNADACRRQKDVVVVPAHVMRSMMSQSVAASGIGGEQTGMGGEGGPIGAAIAAEASAAPTPGGINVTRPSVSGAPKGLQDVLEESPSTEANDGERERKRTESSESTSGGMGSSQYV